MTWVVEFVGGYNRMDYSVSTYPTHWRQIPGVANSEAASNWCYCKNHLYLNSPTPPQPLSSWSRFQPTLNSHRYKETPSSMWIVSVMRVWENSTGHVCNEFLKNLLQLWMSFSLLDLLAKNQDHLSISFLVTPSKFQSFWVPILDTFRRTYIKHRDKADISIDIARAAGKCLVMTCDRQTHQQTN